MTKLDIKFKMDKIFGHKLIGSKRIKRLVLKTVTLLSGKTAEKIAKSTWFVSSFTDGWAFTLRGDELKKGEHLIFLSDELLDQDEKQIIWTILHEIGHVVLGHRNSIGSVQTKSQVRRQEREADEFAAKYLIRV